MTNVHMIKQWQNVAWLGWWNNIKVLRGKWQWHFQGCIQEYSRESLSYKDRVADQNFRQSIVKCREVNLKIAKMEIKSKIVIINILLCLTLINAATTQTTITTLINNIITVKVEIRCVEIKVINWNIVGNKLTCIVGNGTNDLSNFEVYQKVKNESIKAVSVSSKPINYVFFVPVTSFKPLSTVLGDPTLTSDIQVMSIENQPIKLLTAADLKQFGSNLLYLSINKSNITSLGKDLFKHNPNLKFINIENAPLKYIEPGFFEHISHMKKLENINLLNCSCINQSKNQPDIQNATSWIHNCNNQTAMLSILNWKNVINMQENKNFKLKIKKYHHSTLIQVHMPSAVSCLFDMIR